MKQHQRTPSRIRRATVSLAIAATFSLLAAGCAAPAPEVPTDELAADQTLVWGLSNTLQDIKAGADQGGVGYSVQSMVHAGLLRYDAEGKISPDLAEKYEQVDPKTYSFTLREGLEFSDGEPITSETVGATLAYYGTPESGARVRPGVSNIEEFEVTDDLNFTIHLGTNDADFLQYLADPSAFIAPASALVPGAIAEIGAGPFLVDSKEAGVSTTLKKNPTFWDAENVTLEEVDLIFYVDATARTNALLSGDVDLIDYVAWSDFDRIAATDGITLDAKPGSILDLEFNAAEGPFSDPLVRQAAAYAIDRDAVVATAFFGHAKPEYGVPLAVDSPFSSKLSTDVFEYDPEHAKELLAEAGYPDGFSGTLLSTNSQQFYMDASQVVQANLAEVGIDVTIESPDFATRNERSAAGDYDIRFNGGGGIVSSPAWLGAWLGGPPQARSFGYENADFFDAIADGRTAENEQEAKKAYDNALKIYAEDVPLVVLAQREQGFAFKSTVKGFSTLPGFLALYSAQTMANVSIVAE